jgi:putative holliday junction resolvase
LSNTHLTLLGIDYGTRKIGVAVGQTVTRTAMGIALVPVKANEPVWEEMDALVQRWKPNLFVVGLPYNMDGSESDATVRARKLAQTLSARYDRHCEFVDERLSTRAAREITRNNAELIGKKYNDKTKVDALAAQLLLESWFGIDTGSPHTRG